MTRLFTQGFEDGTLQNDPNVIFPDGTGVSNFGYGRRGGFCMTLCSWSGPNGVAYQSPSLGTPTELWVRTAFQPPSGPMTMLSLGNPGRAIPTSMR